MSVNHVSDKVLVSRIYNSYNSKNNLKMSKDLSRHFSKKKKKM